MKHWPVFAADRGKLHYFWAVLRCLQKKRGCGFCMRCNRYSLGFTLALLCMGSIREILGSGTWFGLRIIPESVQTMSIMTLAPGGFFVFGCLIALVNCILMRKGKKPKQEVGCSGCPMAGKCAEAAEGGCK